MTAEVLVFGAVAAAVGAVATLPFPRERSLRRRRATGSARQLAAPVGVAGGLAAAALLPYRLSLIAAVSAPLLSVAVPYLHTRRRRRERQEAIRRDLPALLDLLRVSVEAGRSLPAALAEVGGRSRSPLAREWAAVAAQVAVGVPLAQALERHRSELGMAEIDAFASALARAARHGAPLSDTLAAQARDARLRRRRAIQERAARAAPKMQLVVALLLVPSVMLLVAAALVRALSGGGGGGVFVP